MKNQKHLLFVLLLALVLNASASAKDDWFQVRSKNFNLVGNASEKDIRKVATKLEQFRETFRQLFRTTNLNAPIPTTVFVFKSDSAYKPFKPKRADGKIDEGVAGYFQPGEDINYITLSADGDDSNMYGTIFHEYVHFIIETNFGKSEVPPWFNEGLAEYYQTFTIVEDQKVKLGLPQGEHLMLLQQSSLMPLADLFQLKNYQLQQTGGHSRSIFYAQSWAMVHYFTQTNKSDAMSKFLSLSVAGVPQEKAFQDAFQMTYAQMEVELKRYISKRTFNYNEISFAKKLVFDQEMTTSPMVDPSVNAMLGDLLLHTNRPDDAEPYLMRSISAEPNSVLANTALGMVKMRQRKWDDARKYLDVAVASGQSNHLPYYRYAYLLSREGRDEFGLTTSYSKETAERIRTLLRQAMRISPSFTESHELLAYVNIVTNEELDEAVLVLRQALKVQPHNQRYLLRIAEVLVRQKKTADAIAIAERLVATASDESLKSRAESILTYGKSMAEYEKRKAEYEKQSSGASVNTYVRDGVRTLDPETEKLSAETNRMTLTESLRKTGDGETRIAGRITSISCKSSPVIYTVKTDKETVTVTSKNFDSLDLRVFTGSAEEVSVGCDADLKDLYSLVTYKIAPTTKPASSGEILAIEFVPNGFQPMTDVEIGELRKKIETMRQAQSQAPPPRRVSTGSGIGAGTSEDQDKMRRDAILAQMRSAIAKPGAGEERVLANLDKVECTSKGNFFHFKTAVATLRLLAESPQIKLFTRDLEGVQFKCGMSPVEFPAVIIYNTTEDKKLKHNGTIREIYFVPKSFTLEP